MDLKLPDGDSISLFDRYTDKLDSKSIIITANATVPGVVEAIKKGAFNYLEKPVERGLLLAQVEKILRLNALREGHKTLREEVSSHFNFDNIVYESKAMEAVVSRARILAETSNTILVYGETGCGKEVLSHSIHNASPRKSEILMPVNCASIPSELFESELFGFEKEAFTGAVGNYKGRFVQADRGTLFLDEIGELAQEVKLKQFRSDLYYRLKESSLVIPPLRDRVEDIWPLIRHFFKVYNHVYNKTVTRLSSEVEKFFLTYQWDGNVRELKKVMVCFARRLTRFARQKSRVIKKTDIDR